MGGGVLVIAFEFGNLCFNSPASEQSIIMVIASPSEFSSLDKFITAALTFLETDGELYGKRTVLCRLNGTKLRCVWKRNMIISFIHG